jgi:hypothetical protein
VGLSRGAVVRGGAVSSAGAAPPHTTPRQALSYLLLCSHSRAPPALACAGDGSDWHWVPPEGLGLLLRLAIRCAWTGPSLPNGGTGGSQQRTSAAVPLLPLRGR